MADHPSTARGTEPGLAERWRRLSVVLRTFLMCFAVVALSGIAAAVLVYPRGGGTDSELFDAVARIDTVFFVVAFVLGVVAARRGLRAWLAGYAGTVLGGMALIVAIDLMRPNGGLISILVGSVTSAIIVFAPFAAVAFLISGGLTWGARRLSGS